METQVTLEPVRQLTIKRGLTRLKVIKAQLDDISRKIAKYGALSSMEKADLVDTRVSRDRNHNLAIEEVKSLYQSFNDLTKEFVKIKTAIDKANQETNITIGETVMTINEALIYRNHLATINQSLVQSYRSAVRNAEMKVDRYNNSLSSDLTTEERNSASAEVVYLVDSKLVAEKESFFVTFKTEIDQLIDEANVLTVIELV
jgi:phenylalanyl-tRNA synthetase alpha subunit